MALGAHPDDIEIFMFGLLMACKDRGDEISLVVATDGAAGGVTGGGRDAKTLAEVRAEETRQGLKSLGTPVMLDLPDGMLGASDLASARVSKAITSSKPDLIITHAPEDYHPDHRALAQLVTDAAGFTAPVLYADTLMGVGFMPQFYVDITSYIEIKCAAIMAHQTQNPEKFTQATILNNRFRAAQMNAPDEHYMEAYRSDSRFPFADIRSLLPPAPPLRPFYRGAADALI